MDVLLLASQNTVEMVTPNQAWEKCVMMATHYHVIQSLGVMWIVHVQMEFVETASPSVVKLVMRVL